MKVYVTVSDRYHHVLKIFIQQFQKYWPNQEVVIVCFALPDYSIPSNFSILSLGPQERFPFNKWSDALISLFTQLNDITEDEVFCLMLEDYILTRPVNTEAIRMLYDYMIQFQGVIKMDICEDRLYAHGADLNYDNVGYLDLVRSMPGSQYHMSLWPGLWRRKHMLDILKYDWSPHEVETSGTPILAHRTDLYVLGTRQSPVRITNVVRGADVGSLDLGGLKQVDRDELKESGCIKSE